MPPLPNWLKIALQWLTIAIIFVGGLGPDLAQLAGLVPAQWLANASHVVALCAAIAARLQASPLKKPLLETKPSAVLYAHADEVAENEIAVTQQKKASQAPPPPSKGPPSMTRFTLFLLVVAACTPAEIAQANAAFTDSQIACLAVFNATSVIPPGTEVATVANDAETFCNLAKTVETDIEAIEAAYMASAPAPAGAVYRAARRK
jgi:hypothetical protein